MGSDTDSYVQWAVGMLEALDRAPSDGSAEDRELHAGREEFRAAVAQLLREARGPLSVGVVGEFSAGKSLLIEALLGLPGLLSVSDVATTGNVTALHIGQLTGGERTSRLDGRAVVYCTAAETAELMTHLHGRLEELAPLEGPPDQRSQALHAARPGPDGWAPLVEWCGRHGSALHGARMRAVAAEVELLHTAYEVGTPMLGRRYELSEAQAKRAMSLPGVKLEAGGGDSPALRVKEGEGHRIPDDVLAACVPLIRRVELRVGVPRGIWDLAGARALTLMDFPGLNSPESGERDRFLSRRELRDIHTVLVLVNGQRGPVAQEQDFFDMLREPTADGRERKSDKVLRESLLVAGGRFDQMPVDPSALKAALLDSPERLKEQRLRGLPDTAVLDKIVEAAHRLLPAGQRKQLVLVSAMVGLDRLARSQGVQLDEALRARLRSGAEERLQITELWAKAAARLAADDPGSPLSTALREFAEDGGLDLLRRQLTQHAEKYGGDIRHEAVRRRAEVVDRMRVELISREQAAHPEEACPPEYREIQRTLDETRRSLGDLRDSLVVGMGPGNAWADDELRQYIDGEAATMVAGWPLWKELFASVDREKQLISVRRADRTAADEALRRRVRERARARKFVIADSGGTDTRGPAAADEPEALLPLFRQCYEQLLALVRDWARAAYEQRLERHRGALDELFQMWERVIEREQERGAVGQEHADRLLVLQDMTDVDVWRTAFRDTASPGPDLDEADAAYPLRLDRGFPWHPESPDGRDPWERHIVHAVRIRRELVTALLNLVYKQLAKEHIVLASEAKGLIDAYEEAVGASDTLDLLVSGLRGEGGSPGAAVLDLAGHLDVMPAPGSRYDAAHAPIPRPRP
ncbi:hypothetical protein ABZ837_10925 [Streptomyces sp. NPDC047197]|uniref:hypothetical protein n=1 Tax=Streptomyces sp. NPDC047197 TaxID=3155477 RepID=UPI0033C5C43F